MTWPAVAALAVGTYLLKAAGPLLFGGRTLPAGLARVVDLMPAALLAALVAVQTFPEGLTLDARVAGVAVAGIAVWRRAPFVIVVVLASGVTAAVRWAG